MVGCHNSLLARRSIPDSRRKSGKKERKRTYLVDSFAILIDHEVSGFPFFSLKVSFGNAALHGKMTRFGHHSPNCTSVYITRSGETSLILLLIGSGSGLIRINLTTSIFRLGMMRYPARTCVCVCVNNDKRFNKSSRSHLQIFSLLFNLAC